MTGIVDQVVVNRSQRRLDPRSPESTEGMGTTRSTGRERCQPSISSTVSRDRQTTSIDPDGDLRLKINVLTYTTPKQTPDFSSLPQTTVPSHTPRHPLALGPLLLFPDFDSSDKR